MRSASFIFFLAVQGIHLFLFLTHSRIKLVQPLLDFLVVVEIALISDSQHELVQDDLSSFVFGLDLCNGVVHSPRLISVSINLLLADFELKLGGLFLHFSVGLSLFLRCFELKHLKIMQPLCLIPLLLCHLFFPYSFIL